MGIVRCPRHHYTSPFVTCVRHRTALHGAKRPDRLRGATVNLNATHMSQRLHQKQLAAGRQPKFLGQPGFLLVLKVARATCDGSFHMAGFRKLTDVTWQDDLAAAVIT